MLLVKVRSLLPEIKSVNVMYKQVSEHEHYVFNILDRCSEKGFEYVSSDVMVIVF